MDWVHDDWLIDQEDWWREEVAGAALALHSRTRQPQHAGAIQVVDSVRSGVQ